VHRQRVEQRRLRASTELVGYTDWPGLAQTLCIERRVTERQTGETHVEIAYAVTSLTPHRATPAHLLTLWREHWHIENNLHWVRAVTFGEDGSTVRVGVGPQVLAALRQSGDWAAAIGGGDEHRCRLSPLRGPTRLGAHCSRPRMTTMNKPWSHGRRAQRRGGRRDGRGGGGPRRASRAIVAGQYRLFHRAEIVSLPTCPWTLASRTKRNRIVSPARITDNFVRFQRRKCVYHAPCGMRFR
jgi:hypothetical protein